MSTLKNRARADNAPRAAFYRPFGAFRLALAAMVLAQHGMVLLTAEQKAHAPGLVLGPVAVACFFALSGFIVAEALSLFYVGRPLAFLVNRFLRVVPPYLVALGLAILVQSALFASGRLLPLDDALTGAPWQPRVVLAGIFEIFPALPVRRISGQDFSFIPYAWTLRVECAFYLAAFATCVLAGKSARRCWPVGVSLVLAYTAFGLFLLRHGSGPQQILCVPFFTFGLGCFFLRRDRSPLWRAHLLGVALFVPLAFTYWTQKGHPVLAYQLACVCVLFTLFFGLVWIEHVPARLRRFDKVCGDLSYPLYIGHGVVVVAVLNLAGRQGWPAFAACVAGAFLLAALLHLVAERPLRDLRDRLRGRSV